MNGSGNGVATEETFAVTTEGGQPSLDGFAGATSTDPFADHPALLVGAALLGGFMLAALVSRIGR